MSTGLEAITPEPPALQSWGTGHQSLGSPAAATGRICVKEYEDEGLLSTPPSSTIDDLRARAYQKLQREYGGAYVACREIWKLAGLHRELVFEVVSVANTPQELATSCKAVQGNMSKDIQLRYVSRPTN